MEEEESRNAPGRAILGCRRCGHLFLDADTVSSLRGRRASSTPPPQAPAPRAVVPLDAERTSAPRIKSTTGAHVEHPFFSPGPAIELGVLTTLFALAWLFVWTRFGETVAFFLRIQFHELGHALVAWSTGRRSLPLPFGWTSWSFDRSWLLVAMQLLCTTLLAVHGVRERKPTPIGIAMGLGALFACGLATPLDASEPWLVAGGTIGEALLPALALLAFHAPLPERFRWDFWRWPLAIAAILALASVVQHDLAIGSGARPLPFGSFVTGREGEGDLERLVDDYGWARDDLPPFFATLGWAALTLGTLPHLAIFGARLARARSAAAKAPPPPNHRLAS